MSLEQFEAISNEAEKLAGFVHEWTVVHQQLITLGLGGIVLLYNGRLGCSILLFNCIKGVGLPILQKSFSELYASYTSAKRALKEEGPSLRRAVADMRSLTAEVRALEVVIADLSKAGEGSIDADKMKQNVDKIKSAIARLADASNNAVDVGKRINSKFDYASLRTCATSLYVVSLSALASANSATVANLSIGASLGASLTHGLQALVARYRDRIVAESKKIDRQMELKDTNIAASVGAALLEPDRLPQQLHVASALVGNAVGLSVSMYLTRPARMFAAVTLGAELVVHALQGLLDPHLAKRDLPTVRAHAVALTSALVGLGSLYNAYMILPGASAGPLMETVLAPLVVVESAACLLVAAGNK